MQKTITDTISVHGDVTGQLRLLAQSMKHQPWKMNAVLPAETTSDKTQMKQITNDLRRMGIHSELQPSSQGDIVLAMSYAPPTKSTAERIAHGTQEYAKGIISDSARLIGAIYLVGDALVTASPMMNKNASSGPKESFKVKMKDPYNQMQLFQGITTVLQSIIYAHYARDGKETLVHSMNDHIQIAKDEHQNPLDVSLWDNHEEEQGVWKNFNQYMHDHAITIGASILIAGQLGYIGSGMLRYNRWGKHLKDFENGKLAGEVDEFLKTFQEGKKLTTLQKIKENRKIGLQEVGRGLLSTTAWLAFIQTGKEQKNKANWSDPVTRTQQEFEENPQRFASMMSAVSSVFGMMAGAGKGNPLQKLGEGTYLGADALMFVTKKKDYGSENAGRSDIISQGGAEFISHLPFALGPNAQKRFVGELSRYVIEHPTGSSTQLPDPAHREQRIAQVSSEMSRILQDTVTGYNKVINAASDIVEDFPEEQRPALVKQLSLFIANQSTVYATPQEVEKSMENRLSISMHSGTTPNMTELSVAMKRLIDAIPSMNHVSDAVRLYQLVENAERQHSPKQPQPTAKVQLASHLGQQADLSRALNT